MDKENILNFKKEDDIKAPEGEIEVHGFILSNGDQVLTEVIESKEEDLFFKNPFFVSLIVQPGGRTGIIMKPFVGYSNQEEFGPINGVAFICGFEVPENMQEEYRNMILKLRANRAGLIIGQGMKVGPPQPPTDIRGK